jgi:hypothetical protein
MNAKASAVGRTCLRYQSARLVAPENEGMAMHGQFSDEATARPFALT